MASTHNRGFEGRLASDWRRHRWGNSDLGLDRRPRLMSVVNFGRAPRFVGVVLAGAVSVRSCRRLPDSEPGS